MKRIIYHGISSNNKVIRSDEGWIKEKNLECTTKYCCTCGHRGCFEPHVPRSNKALKKNKFYYKSKSHIPKAARDENYWKIE